MDDRFSLTLYHIEENAIHEILVWLVFFPKMDGYDTDEALPNI